MSRSRRAPARTDDPSPDLESARRAWGALVQAIETEASRELLLRAVREADAALMRVFESRPSERLSITTAVRAPRLSFDDLLGSSPLLVRARELARRAAQVPASVLITGESGTGKEVVAQAIHSASPHGGEPFVAINCAAIPRELLEAELFGYERGAFTGARAEGALGKIALAGSGTLLLDEIGDLPLDMQAKLLRVLQERVFSPLGSTEELPLSARIIATTHRDLDQAVAHGTFRLDLLHRLRVLSIVLPALRERVEDLGPLALHFLRRFAIAQGKAARELSPRVLEQLTEHPWPGNIRELANVLEREVSLLSPDTPCLDALSVPFSPTERAPLTVVPMAEVERRAHLEALQACGGNLTQAAKALGVSRAQFYVKLQRWQAELEDEARKP